MTPNDIAISNAYNYGTRQELVEVHINLLNERKKVGDFIDLFLDKYDAKMQFAPPEHKLWQLFRKKHAEYGEIERCIKSADYFLKKK